MRTVRKLSESWCSIQTRIRETYPPEQVKAALVAWAITYDAWETYDPRRRARVMSRIERYLKGEIQVDSSTRFCALIIKYGRPKALDAVTRAGCPPDAWGPAGRVSSLERKAVIDAAERILLSEEGAAKQYPLPTFKLIRAERIEVGDIIWYDARMRLVVSNYLHSASPYCKMSLSTGRSDTSFYTGRAITRGQYVKKLIRSYELVNI